MSLASNTYEAERLDALSFSLRHAQVVIGRGDRWKAIEALRKARQQINETLARLEANQQASAYPVPSRDACDCKGITGDNGNCDDSCRRDGLR